MEAWRASRAVVVVGAVVVSGCSLGPTFQDQTGTSPSSRPGPDPSFQVLVTTTYQPAPLSGGTLTVLDDRTVLVADPDRERLWRVRIDGFASGVEGYAEFAAGSRPRRSVVAPDGMVHVLLRGAGQVAHVPAAALRGRSALAGPQLRAACLEPRDLALDDASGELLVSCRDGTLLRLGASGTSATRLAADLRDLVPGPEGLAYTTFQRAELHSPDGRVQGPPGAAPQDAPSVPAVAWRTVPTPAGPLMLHQLASTASIPVATAVTSTGVSPYGSGGGSSFGNGCQPGVVSSALTLFPPGGPPSTVRVADLLAVDVAAWQPAPGSLLVAVAGGAGSGLTVYSAVLDEQGAFTDPDLCGRVALSLPGGQVTGVRFLADGTLVAHDRQNSRVFLLPFSAGPTGPTFDPSRQQWVAYAFDSVDSPGSLLFHQAPSMSSPAGATLACASCHPEALEDGHTWIIDGEPRRTQSLAGGVSGRAPFHWQGDRPTLAALLDDTFTRRMGGGTPSPAVVESLRGFLDSVPALRTPQLPADRKALGQAAFARAGCAGCHQGPQLAGQRADVGTGGTFKAPSLIGLHARAGLMHSGCARTLRDRFDGTACGGTAHGDAGRLTAGELDWLLAYLETL